MNQKKQNTIEEFREWLGPCPELTIKQKEMVDRVANNLAMLLNKIQITKNDEGIIEKRLKGEIQ